MGQPSQVAFAEGIWELGARYPEATAGHGSAVQQPYYHLLP